MNLLTVNYASQGPAIQSGQAVDAPAAPSLDNATVDRDDIGQIIVSGIFNGNIIQQYIFPTAFPCLIAFDPGSLNFFIATDLSVLTADHLILDIYYG